MVVVVVLVEETGFPCNVSIRVKQGFRIKVETLPINDGET